MDENRRERLDRRERWIVQQLKQLMARYLSEAEPLTTELAELRGHRDGRIYQLPDGTFYRYTGPVPPYYLPDEPR